MNNVRTIYADWYGGIVRTDGGPQLAYQGDHLSNMVIFDGAPSLPNYYLLVEMKTDDSGDVVTLPEIRLEGAYWLIPNYYTQIVQTITFQVCTKTSSGDFEKHSAKFTGTILPTIKHDGEPIDQSSMFDPYINILDERVNKLIDDSGKLIVSDELATTAVNAWLEDHPEATTTVQDGSLTESKFSNALKLKAIKDYVTPEMFGAKGDGVADDTSAIQQAIDNIGGKTVYLSPKTYKTTGPLYLNDLNFLNDGVIKYTGAGYAVVFSPSANIDCAYIKLGKIYAYSGNGLLIEAKNAWIQYVTFDFIVIGVSAAGNCVTTKIIGAKWCNEIRFINGRFTDGLNGVYIDNSEKTGAGLISHWTFDKVGFEGCTNGVNIPANITRLSFANCRAEESISDVVYSRAETTAKQQFITWAGSPVNESYWRNCRNYYLMCLSGFINYRGAYVSVYPIVYYNEMLYGLKYQEGKARNLTSYGAYSYDEATAKQEIDFSKVYDYTTDGQDLYERAQSRVFNMNTNNASATETDVYLDPRMFIGFATPSNSFLLLLVQSPNNVLNIYNTKGGTLIYSKTNGGSTTYPALVITNNNGFYIIEQVTVTRKST